jgi:hypothetical protein
MKTLSTHLLRRRELVNLMKRNNLNAHEVADLTGRKHQTVRTWLCGTRNIPGHAIELLQFKTDRRA